MSKTVATKADVKLLIDQMRAKGEVVTRAEVGRRLREMLGRTLDPNTLFRYMEEIKDV